MNGDKVDSILALEQGFSNLVLDEVEMLITYAIHCLCKKYCNKSSDSHTGLAVPTWSVNGTYGGSVYFDAFADLPDEYRIAWILGEIGNVTVIVEVNPGHAPEYHPRYRGRSQIFRNETLRLENLTYADEGHYGLYVFNENTFETQIVSYNLTLYAFLNIPTLGITSEGIVAGTDVTLQCDDGSQMVTSYTFYRDGQKIICSDRVICRGSFLDFTPISESDSGSYTCTIQNPVSANTSNPRSLNVAVPVSAVTLTSNTSHLLLWPGRDSVALRCSSNGTDVTYSWSLDGAALPQDPRYQPTQNNSALIISPISPKDHGYFMCTARNWINSENSSRVNLNLASPVSAVTLTSNTSAVLWAGQDSASLYCSAQGSAITFSWRLNGEPVSPDPPYYITQGDSPPNSTLTISPVSRHDAGPFTCMASNMANSETSNALDLTLEPDLTAPSLSIISDLIANGTDVTLQCDAGGQNVTSYTFYRDGQKIICSDRVICRGSFLDFTPISENDSGSYTCTIQNPVSSNTSNSLSLTVSVPVSAVALTSNTSHLLLWPGRDSVSLRCSSNGTDVTYSWSLDGAALPQDPRYQPTRNNSVLIISPISAKDHGYFMCTARNRINSENSSRVNLNLASPVSAVTLTSNTSVVLWAGQDSVSLYCSAQGSAITFSWRLNGEPVSPNPPYSITQGDSPPSSTLTISPVSRHDAGPFTCTASNVANSETSNALNLSLGWHPEGNVLCLATTANNDGYVLLGCSWPKGNPPANVTMEVNNTLSTAWTTVTRNISKDHILKGSNLTCFGDQLGKTSSCTVVLEPPYCPTMYNNSAVIHIKEGEPVAMTVRLRPGLPAQFTWFHLNPDPVPVTVQGRRSISVESNSSTSTLVVSQAKITESGKYECRAINIFGTETFNFDLRVTKQELSVSHTLKMSFINLFHHSTLTARREKSLESKNQKQRLCNVAKITVEAESLSYATSVCGFSVNPSFPNRRGI
ncbi:cell adhesion molecule CEACAM5-like [Anomaloglossus baeobatrachus]|uniref:cell adhesion molecule CEACAM5-like n=1 Tax=Anomaloglossus baeobatrachus TaxID=238106 RepID=UPI003F503741